MTNEALAALLDDYADDVDSIDTVGGRTAGDADTLRSAAVQIRRIAELEAGIRGHRTDYRKYGHDPLADRELWTLVSHDAKEADA